MFQADPNFNIVLLTTVVVGILGAVPVLIGVLIANNARKRREAEIIKLAIEKGQPLPSFPVSSSRYGTLKAGMIWIAVGLGIVLMVLIESEGRPEGVSLGLIPILVGIALCISWFLERKEKSQESISGI